MTSSLPLILLSAFFLAGCATSYESSNILTGGFSETMLGPDVARVVFRGNSSTSKERAQDLALLRAAELALKAGFPYFTVLEETNEARRSTPSGSDISISMPKTGILVQFLKEKSPGTLAFDCEFLMRTLKEKYKIK